jgi:hypothetical protein
MSSLPSPIQRSIAASRFSTGLTATQAGILLFGALAAIFLAWPVWRTAFSLEINRNEPWNAWFIDAALHGTALYPGGDDLIVNNYPPLSFYIVGLLSKLTGDTILAGRLVSLASTALVSAAAAFCIRGLGGSRPAAAFGGFWLFATLSHFFPRYVGVNDPSLLGLALMGFALAYFLHRLSSGRAVEPAIALMVLAGFTKHNMPAVPLAAFLWLATAHKRSLVRALLFGAGLCTGAFLLCIAIYGLNFAEQMAVPREITFGHMLATLNKLQWIAPALVVWCFWAWPNRKEPAARFTAILVAISLASGLFQAAGAGVTINAHFEVVFASAVAVAVAFEGIGKTALADRFGTGAVQTAVVAILVLRLLLSQQLEPYLVLTSPSYREEVRQNAAVMDAEIARVRAIPGAVNCSVMTVCYLAGKAFVYDGFWMGQLTAKGKRTKSGIEQAVEDKGIRFEDIDTRVVREKKRLF